MEQCEVLENKVTEARGWGCIVSDSLLVSGAELLTSGSLSLTLRAHSGVRAIREKGGTSEPWLGQFQ